MQKSLEKVQIPAMVLYFWSSLCVYHSMIFGIPNLMFSFILIIKYSFKKNGGGGGGNQDLDSHTFPNLVKLQWFCPDS